MTSTTLKVMSDERLDQRNAVPPLYGRNLTVSLQRVLSSPKSIQKTTVD